MTDFRKKFHLYTVVHYLKQQEAEMFGINSPYLQACVENDAALFRQPPSLLDNFLYPYLYQKDTE